MFGKKKQPPIKSLIAHGSRIEGNYIFSEGLRVDGEVVGDIRAHPDHPSILVISESATVTGAVHADHVIINGRSRGRCMRLNCWNCSPRPILKGMSLHGDLKCTRAP